MKNADRPAIPVTMNFATHDGEASMGLSKREYLAGLAMQGILSAGALQPNIEDTNYAAHMAVVCADALLERLEKPTAS